MAHRLATAIIANGNMGGAIAANANTRDAGDVGGDWGLGGRQGIPRGQASE